MKVLQINAVDNLGIVNKIVEIKNTPTEYIRNNFMMQENYNSYIKLYYEISK